MKPFTLTFEVPDLPKTPNQLLGAHWRVRSGEAKKWDRTIWRYVWPYKPETPLTKATLTLTRISNGRMDRDNLRSSFKSVVDALVKNGILIDDNPDVIGEPTIIHEKGKPSKIRVQITETIKE